MLKLCRVYFCDCCRTKALPQFIGEKRPRGYKTLPFDWEHIAGQDLCPRCAHDFHILEKMKGKNND